MGFVEAAILILFGIFAYHKVKEKGVIGSWSWWRVTSPLWIYAIIAIFVGILFFGFVSTFMVMPTAGF